MNIEIAHKECCKLIDEFEKDKKTFLAKEYKEASVRQYFINPFFEDVLGWDVRQKKGKTKNTTEVTVEESQVQEKEKGKKSVDYAFHIINNNSKKPVFFVEAKKPSVEVKSKEEYKQIKGYAKKARLPISILTDFEQFHIVDCRAKMTEANVLGGDNKEFYYTDFRDKKKFEFLYNLFSRDAVYTGSIEKYVATLKPVKGYQTSKDPLEIIGDEFLNYIEELRTKIAKALKKNDNDLDGEQLTEATQKIIDRLVFTRFLEDKGIEDTSWIKKWSENKNAFETFIKDCDSLDRIYNGAVYHRYTLIDKPKYIKNDNWFIEVCNEMIDPYSDFQFNFNYIPIEILGSVYERFLGSVIRTTAKDAKPEQKPEVRKAGGVYYTPKYIVDYIVENTVGKLIEGKKPKEISKLKFADIACGSGSFLIGVYDCLLKYHNNYYNQNPKQAEADNCLKQANNSFRLSIRQKRDVLINNVFGVDIDAQAVEVAQLSLYLKMLEEETQETLRLKGNTLFTNERVLPDLKNNIVCGNSLIGTDIKKNDELFDFEDYKHLNPMDYDVKFPLIMKNGGFDAIVGNPPYVDIKGLNAVDVDYYFDKYKTTENRINLYAVFIEKALTLLKKNALFSYIIPNSILYQSSYLKLRKQILDKYNLHKIIRVPDNVFIGVKAETAIFILGNESRNEEVGLILYERNEKINYIDDFRLAIISKKDWQNHPLSTWDVYSNPAINSLLNKLETNTVPLINKVNFCLGLTPYDAYKGHTKKQIEERVFHSQTPKDKTFKKILEGSNVQRYSVDNNVKEYISYGAWLGAPREKKFFTNPRILIRQIVSGNPLRIFAGYTQEELYNAQSIFNIINKEGEDFDLLLLTAILNSTLINFYHKYKFLDLSKNLFQKILIQNCKQFPIPKKVDSKKETQIVSLVNQMLQLKPKISVAKTEKEKDFFEHQCESIDNQIDKLVYQLYDLTKEEIEIIERKN
jgi:hypothetical protein